MFKSDKMATPFVIFGVYTERPPALCVMYFTLLDKYNLIILLNFELLLPQDEILQQAPVHFQSMRERLL